MAAHDENDTSNLLKKPFDDLDFEQLQHEFDGLLSGNERPTSDILSDKQNALPDLFLQDTHELLTPAEGHAFDLAPEAKAPVHPDMVEDHVMQHRSGGGRFVMLASIIVLTVAGGIYWLVGESEEETEQLASSQQAISPAAGKQQGLADSSLVNPTETAQTLEETLPAITTLQKSPVRSRPVATTVMDEPGDWVIDLASVNSDKSARQHVARIHAMGVESKAVQINDKGKNFYHIRIVGFTSKLEAMKRRDALARKLGVRGAKVEKL